MRTVLAREAVQYQIKVDPSAPVQRRSRPVLGHDGDGRLSVAWNAVGRDTDAPITPGLAKALAAAQTLVESPDVQFRIKLEPGTPHPHPHLPAIGVVSGTGMGGCPG